MIRMSICERWISTPNVDIKCRLRVSAPNIHPKYRLQTSSLNDDSECEWFRISTLPVRVSTPKVDSKWQLRMSMSHSSDSECQLKYSTPTLACDTWLRHLNPILAVIEFRYLGWIFGVDTRSRHLMSTFSVHVWTFGFTHLESFGVGVDIRSLHSESILNVDIQSYNSN